MTPETLRELLEAVRAGTLDPDAAAERLRRFPVEDLDDAAVDQHRALRCGFPEVIFGQGKTPAQVLAVAEALVAAGHDLLATRLAPEALALLHERFPGGDAVAEARLFRHRSGRPLPPAGAVAVISAGTSDQPVAEEAAWTLDTLGVPVRRVRDAGVAGIHRLLRHRDLLHEVEALVVVAGMEGALPSVVGGLTDRPVIAVPTSVGYGASLGGLTALFAMLNSCASGVTVVNIDNGFGGGYAAALVARRAAAPRPDPVEKLP